MIIPTFDLLQLCWKREKILLWLIFSIGKVRKDFLKFPACCCILLFFYINNIIFAIARLTGSLKGRRGGEISRRMEERFGLRCVRTFHFLWSEVSVLKQNEDKQRKTGQVSRFILSSVILQMHCHSFTLHTGSFQSSCRSPCMLAQIVILRMATCLV